MNHIQNIEIKNFKSIWHQKIEDCRRINIFIGYPNTGKSNILEAIGLYGIHSRNSRLDSYVRYEEFETLFFNGDVQDHFEVRLNKNRRIFGYLKDDLLEIHKEYVSEPALFDDSGFHKNKLIKNEHIQTQQTFKVKQNLFEIYDFVSHPIITTYKDNILNIKKYVYNNKMMFLKSADSHLSVPFGENIFSILSSKNNISKSVGELFNYYNIKLNIDKVTNEIRLLKYLSEDVIFTVPYSMVADTLKRLIFYKVAILSNEDSILLFEEPEAHMFPPYISKFTSDMMYDENNNQYFIATHSPFVLNDFMENLEKDEYSIYTVGYEKETGETLIRRMTDEDLHEIYQYGVDLFLNLENYLPHAQQQ